MMFARELASAAPWSDDDPDGVQDGGDPLDLADLVATGRRHDVARATAGVRNAVTDTSGSVANDAGGGSWG